MSQIPGTGMMNRPNHVMAPVDMKDQSGPMHENVGDVPSGCFKGSWVSWK
jgi:hypothetical protein